MEAIDHPLTVPIPVPPPVEAPPPALPDPAQPKSRRRRGKVARLPLPLRQQLNQLLDEGASYSDIIQRLGPEAQGLSENNTSRWFQSGHQDWLKHQLWLEDTRSRLDFSTEVVTENGGATVHHANLHVAATQLIQSLVDHGEDLLVTEPQKYVALLNSITRLSREALNYQKYSEACILARAEVAKLKDPTRKLTDAETLAIVNRLDEILGFK